MNKWLRAAIFVLPALVIAAVYGYLYVALGLGRQLDNVLRTLLVVGALVAFSAPVLALPRKWIGAPIALGVSGTMAVGLFVATWLFYGPKAQEENDRRHHVRQANAELLARAETKAPCANGDTAVIVRVRNVRTNGERLMLFVVPHSGTLRFRMLAAADGEYREPPRAQDVAKWVERTGTTCRNEQFASIDAMLAVLQSHYVIERARLEKDFP